MVQADKSTTELSERRHFSQVPPIPSPFLSESIFLSDTAKRGAGHTVPSAEASEVSEVLGARNTRNKQAAPLVRGKLPTSLDALPGNGTGASSPSGEDTQCRNPTLAKCGGEAQHSQSWGLGVLRDSRMFRVRHQGPKNLALRCSWCH
jgi:hypothetical protein